MAVITLTNGPDVYEHYYDNDIIYGLGGNDWIYDFGESNRIYGGSGFDQIMAGPGDDHLFAGPGSAWMWGGSGKDWFRLDAETEAVEIFDFKSGDDRIDVREWGISDLSQILAFAEHRSTGTGMKGYGHNMQIADVLPQDLVPTDFVFASPTERVFEGGSGSDALFGSRYADTINGFAHNDILLGGLGNDTLNGGAGNDTLWGNAGLDTMTGGSGADVFAFQFAADSPMTGARDRIMDFEQGIDIIDVRKVDAKDDVANNQTFEFIGRDQFDNRGQVRYVYDGDNTKLAFNIDLDANAEFQIVLVGHYVLTAADFIL